MIKEDGSEAGPGEAGELCVQGPQVMQGYWQRPEESAQVLVDGWLHTGDVAEMSADGFVKIVDRLKDMIVISGFKVFPNEVEDCLAHLEGVAECAVIGVPAGESGEAVKAFVVVRPGMSLTIEQVREHCKKSLTNYKVPKLVEIPHRAAQDQRGQDPAQNPARRRAGETGRQRSVSLQPLYHQSFGQGPDLVFLHGFLGSGDNFWPHAQALKDHYRCWLLDLPGHGRSPHIPSYTMTSLAEGVLQTLQDLGLGPLRVVGHSLGGKVAARMAQLTPAALSHVVMADITPAPTRPKHALILQAMRSLPLAGLAKRDDAELYLREAEPVMDVRRFLLKNLAAKEGGGWEWKPILWDLNATNGTCCCKPSTGRLFWGQPLLIRALRSDYVSDADVLVAKKVFPNLAVKTMDTGHWLHAEKPEAFVELLRDFLK